MEITERIVRLIRLAHIFRHSHVRLPESSFRKRLQTICTRFAQDLHKIYEKEDSGKIHKRRRCTEREAKHLNRLRAGLKVLEFALPAAKKFTLLAKESLKVCL